MVKFIDKNIDVTSDTGIVPGFATPKSFFWNNVWVHVSQVLELWKDTGIWWEGETEKTFFRVETAGGSLYELYLDEKKQTWFLYRVYD